jgi:hypothetical protein
MSEMRRWVSGGCSVFRAQRVSSGLQEVWVALGVDALLTTSVGRGSTAEEAEADALAKLGAPSLFDAG